MKFLNGQKIYIPTPFDTKIEITEEGIKKRNRFYNFKDFIGISRYDSCFWRQMTKWGPFSILYTKDLKSVRIPGYFKLKHQHEFNSSKNNYDFLINLVIEKNPSLSNNQCPEFFRWTFASLLFSIIVLPVTIFLWTRNLDKTFVISLLLILPLIFWGFAKDRKEKKDFLIKLAN